MEADVIFGFFFVENTIPALCLSGVSVREPGCLPPRNLREKEASNIMAGNRNLRWEDIDKSNTELSVLMQHIEVHNKTEGKSPRTVGRYNEVLGMFIKWLKEDGRSTAIGDIDEVSYFFNSDKPSLFGRAVDRPILETGSRCGGR